MSTADALERLHGAFAIELKEDGADPGEGTIEGYASYFRERDSGNDIVMPGAFAKSLKERRTQKAWKIPMFFGHAHSSVPVGVWTDIVEDAKGLKVTGKLIFQNDDARQAYAVMKAGGEMGISIGYKCVRKEIESVRDDALGYDVSIRKLIEVDLREISLVAMPMLDSARVTKVKSEGEAAPDAGHAAVIRALADINLGFAASNAIDRVLQTLKP
jgi:HK97 family phage prohead protease